MTPSGGGGAPLWLVVMLALAGAGVGVLISRRLATGMYRRDAEHARPVPAHGWWVTAGLALAWAGLAWRFGAGPGGAALPAYLYLAALGLTLTAIDLDVHRLPDALVLPAYPLGVVLLALASWADGDWAALVRALVAGAALWAVYLVLALVSPGGLGFGDVKLAGVIGLFLGWLGWGSPVLATFAGFVIGGLAALALLLSRRASRGTHFAFGPSMVLGAAVALYLPVQLLAGSGTG